MRALLAFWVVMLLTAGGGAGWLAYLDRPLAVVATAKPVVEAAGPRAPDVDLLETRADDPDAMLPRIGADGRRPMSYYAAVARVPAGFKRVALLVAGIGLSQSSSHDVIEQLPSAVSLAVSPFAADPKPLIEEARKLGHEYLISLPMEPGNWPLADEGAHELLTGAEPGKNFVNLEEALSLEQGYVGVTSALDGLRGENFLRADDQYQWLQDQLNRRGLLFIDARAGITAPLRVPGRSVDMVIDDPPDAASIDAKLSALTALVQSGTGALGVVGPMRPVTFEHVKKWIAGLASQHIALVPVSALVAGVNATP